MRKEKLTPEQEGKIPAYAKFGRELCEGKGLVDRKKVGQALDTLYKLAKLEAPTEKVWFPSPKAASETLKKEFEANLTVREQLCKVIQDTLNLSITGLSADIWQQLTEKIWSSTWSQVTDPIMRLVRNQMKWEDGSREVTTCYMGSFDGGLVAILKYFREVLELKHIKKNLVEALVTLTQAGLWWPFRGKVILTERPILHYEDVAPPSKQQLEEWARMDQERGFPIQRDTGPRRRLSNPKGRAIEYPDGWGVSFIRGVHVPDLLVDSPESITGEMIQKEQNQEVRRVMAEVMGWDRFLEVMKAKAVHSDDFGTLYKIDMRDDEPVALVKVVNSTAEPDGSFKNYILRVPPATERAKQGIAWTFGLAEEEYQPDMQT